MRKNLLLMASFESDFLGTIEIIDGEIFLQGSDQQLNEFLGYVQTSWKKPFLNIVAPTHIEIAQKP